VEDAFGPISIVYNREIVIMKTALVSIVMVVLVACAAIAAQPIITKSKDVTSKDIPLTFKLEKTTWDGSDIRVWGTVKNPSKTKYTSVQVIFTAKDGNGNFIGRHTWFTDPSEIAEGQVGYIEGDFVDCDGKQPTVLEYSVIGEK
jgi:hypothetical protein